MDDKLTPQQINEALKGTKYEGAGTGKWYVNPKMRLMVFDDSGRTVGNCGGSVSGHEDITEQENRQTHNAILIADANTNAARTILLQRELDEQCRLNGMGAERELKLIAQLESATRELTAAKARIAELERKVDRLNGLIHVYTRTNQ